MVKGLQIANTKDNVSLAKLYIEFDTFNKKHDSKLKVYTYKQYLKWAKVSLCNNDKTTSLIYLNKLPVGYICYYEIPQAKTLFLEVIFISKENRLKGIGKAVIDILRKEAKKKKYSLSIEVYPWNVKALKFYKKLGFKEDKSIKLII